jgi:hypothetical protein
MCSLEGTAFAFSCCRYSLAKDLTERTKDTAHNSLMAMIASKNSHLLFLNGAALKR